MVKDTHKHILMNMISKAKNSHKILEGSDMLIFPVVLITPTRMVLMNSPKSGSHYPPSACSLL